MAVLLHQLICQHRIYDLRVNRQHLKKLFLLVNVGLSASYRSVFPHATYQPMRVILSLLVLVTLSSCHRNTKYPYTLADFQGTVQPYLNNIVNIGFIGERNYECIGMLDSLMTDAQLLKLSRCEHPLLRSVALDILLHRPSIDQYGVFMGHLDDTARVNWYFQCASFEWTYVSDYMFFGYEWKTEAARDSTLRKVLTEHNYLEHAYYKVGTVQQDTSYYKIVRTMAEREIRMETRSNALYALASYKDPADTAFLRDVLNTRAYMLDGTCLALMQAYPNTSYQPILEKYLRTLYRNMCRFELSPYDNEVALYFNAIASYKNKESADLLKKIFFRQPMLSCSLKDTSQFRSVLYKAIVDNDCPLYLEMASIARPYLEKEKKEAIELPPIYPDTTSLEKAPTSFRW